MTARGPGSAVRPVVSIVVPAYNHERFVGAAIESVLGQTTGDLELIVIDDGSRDGTLEVIRSYRDPRLRVYTQPNRGLSVTLNRGLELANGEFWGFLPSDDEFIAEKLERQLALLHAEPGLGVVFTFQRVIDAAGTEIEDDPIVEWTRVPWRTRDEILPALFERNFLVAPSMLTRAETLRCAGGFDEGLRYTQDYDLWLRLLPETDARLDPEPLVAYRWHGGNLTYAATEETIYERAIVLLKAYRTLTLEAIFPALRGRPDPAARARAHLTLAGLLSRSGLVELLPVAQIQVNEARRLDPSCVVDPALADLLVRRPAFVDLRDDRLHARERQLGEHQRAEEERLAEKQRWLEGWEGKLRGAQEELERARSRWFVRLAVWLGRRSRVRLPSPRRAIEYQARRLWSCLPSTSRAILRRPLARAYGALFGSGGVFAREVAPPAGPPPAAGAPPSWRFRALPKVSVVLPVYNHAALLAESIESVLGQTYPNVELVVVNDGSTDDVEPVLARYAEHPRIRVLSKPTNRGLPRALTAGFREARGDFFTWTSADNLALPEQIERLVDFLLRRPDADMVYSNVEVIDDEGNLLTGSDYRPHNQSPPGSSLIALPHTVETLGEIEDNFINASFLYRAELADIFGAYDWTLLGTEDYDYWLRIASHFTIRHIDTEAPLYRYRVHGNTMSERHGVAEIHENVRTLVARHRERIAYYREAFEVVLVTDRGPVWSEPGRYERLVEVWLRRGTPVAWLSVGPAPEPGGRPGVRYGRVSPGSSPRDLLERGTSFRKRLLLWASAELAPADVAGLRRDTDMYCVLDAPLPAERWGGRVDAVTAWAVAHGAAASTGDVIRCPAGAGVEVDPVLRKARDNRYPIWELPVRGDALFLCYVPPDAQALDVEALAAAARARPRFQFAVVPRERGARDWSRALRALPNVGLLQPRGTRDLYRLVSVCQGLLLPLRGTVPDPVPLVEEFLGLLLATTRPAVMPATLPVPDDVPGCFRYRTPEELPEALDHARAHPPSPAACDGYLARRSWKAQVDRITATANNGLFLRRTRPADSADVPAVPLDATLPSRPTILVEVRNLDKGGLEEVIYGLLTHLDYLRFRAVVVCVEGEGQVAERCRRAGILVYGLTGDKRAAYEEILDRHVPAVLNTHYSHFGVSLAAARGIPVIEVFQNVYAWWGPADVRECRARDPLVSSYVAVSEAVEAYAREVLGLPPEKIVQIPNGVDVARHCRLRARTPRLTRSQLGLSGDDYVFLHLASVDGRKGHNALIAALARVAPRHPRVRVLSAGPVMDGPYHDTMRERVRHHGLEAHFRFLGFMEDVADLYRLADAFVLPSLVEGMSVALLEALYHGLPVIATRVGGAGTILDDGACGRLIPPAYPGPRPPDPGSLRRCALEETPSNVAELAAAMEDFLTRPAHWRARGAAGTELVERVYDMRRVARRYEDLFEAVIGGAKARREAAR